MNDVARFQNDVLSHWREHGRHDLPWRKTTNPYRIMVSEVMLQQTQVPRVLEKYKEFLRAFPSVAALARSDLAPVLRVWSGLGYNRRGKYLHDTAKAIAANHGGRVPRMTADLRKLPGMGPYTTSAIRVFAWNLPDVLLETNIRAVYIHHFYQGRTSINDCELSAIAESAAAGQDPRVWHWALMDYGSEIKRLHKNPTRRSATYSMQSKFEGSLRQVRGSILRLLHSGAHGDLALARKLSFDERMVRAALSGLRKDGLIISEKGSWRIP